MARQYARKLSKRQARKRLGMTQSEFAKAVGVSRSTIQRAEKSGKTTNANLLEAYENIEKNRELSKQFKEKRRSVINRLQKLKEAGLENTPAYRNLYDSVPTLEELLHDPATTKRKLSKMQKFLEYQTSTVKGAKEWKENVKEAATQTAGIDIEFEDGTEDQQFEDFLNVFFQVLETLRYDRSFSKYWAEGKFDSEQAREDIKVVINAGLINKDTITFQYVIDKLRDLQ